MDDPEVVPSAEAPSHDEAPAAASAPPVESTEATSPPRDIKPVMPGIEGGSNPEPVPGPGLVGSIMGFFRGIKEELEVLDQDMTERVRDESRLTAEGVDCVERVAKFKELSTDYRNLQQQAVKLSTALENVTKAHEAMAERLRDDAKLFADRANVTDSLEDGVVNETLRLDSAKTGQESVLLQEAGAMHTGLAERAGGLRKTIDSFANSVTEFNDKVMGDLEDAVKIYKRNRLLLDAMQKKFEPDQAAVAELTAATAKSKESVDVKLTLLQEKRFNDLSEIAGVMQSSLREFVLAAKSTVQ